MKKFLKIIGVFLILLLFVACLSRKKIYRLNFALKMFSGVEMVDRFRTVEDYFPTRIIEPNESPSSFTRAYQEIELPTTYDYRGKSKSTQRLMDITDATGLLVIKNDTILFEEYFHGNTEDSHTIAWSVTKSFVSALMGIAIEEGIVTSIDDTVIQYVPELKGSAYENITIKNLLQMSSGVRWNEDYGDFNSDINRFGRTLALGSSFESFVQSLETAREQGTYCLYNSMDTQVLGMIISRASGMSLSNYLEAKIWKPIGMENKAWWVIDDVGDEFAAAGLNASLRDYARFGKLYLNKGTFNGEQIVPADWVEQSLTPDAPHLMPGKRSFGYGYQWWIPQSEQGEFMAIGVYNQFIYVNPAENVIIVKSSAYSSYGSGDEYDTYSDYESLAFFREIVKRLNGGKKLL